MFRSFIRASIAMMIPTLMAAILGGCAATGGSGATASDRGGPQSMGDMDSEARLPDAPTSHKASLPGPQAAGSHYAD